MMVFDPISLHSAVRSLTKVGVATGLTLNITAPVYLEPMVINFPASQLVTTSSCFVGVNGVSLGCSVVNSSAIMTVNVAGNAVYTVDGLQNQLYFSSAAQFD